MVTTQNDVLTGVPELALKLPIGQKSAVLLLNSSVAFSPARPQPSTGYNMSPDAKE